MDGNSGPDYRAVFELSGIPTYTFVAPMEYDKLLVALRSPGRGAVIEGPSGIGKATAATRALGELGAEDQVLKLSARKRADREVIAELARMESIGMVIVDDFDPRCDANRRAQATSSRIQSP